LECAADAAFARSRVQAARVRESKVTVKIPRPLYRKVQQVVDGSGFNSPTDFIVYVLRDLMGEAEDHPREFTQEELDGIKRKLKNLGYL
jgi:Arc/MetJ-type ribon-helix-helix transcriptional regulator